MEEKWETAPHRAWRDNTQWLLNHIVAWFLAFIVPGGGTMLATLFIPANVDLKVAALYGFLGGIAGLLLVFTAVYAWNLFRAPYKQRNEARDISRAKSEPIPLENRKELRGAIASVENTTIQLVNKVNELKNADSQNPYLAELATVADETYDRWNESMNELRRQYLIAGDAYESVCVELTGFIWMQIAAIMEKLKYPEDIKPIVLKDVLQFVGALGGRVKEALRKIDEISGQAPDKKGSQTE